MVFFYMQVHHSSLWKAIFQAMDGSDFEVRQSALEDVNTLLHDSLWNAKSLAYNKEWAILLMRS